VAAAELLGVRGGDRGVGAVVGWLLKDEPAPGAEGAEMQEKEEEEKEAP